jgi:hypothetical protein
MGETKTDDVVAFKRAAAAVTIERIRATMMQAWAQLRMQRRRQPPDPPRPGRPRDAGFRETAALPKAGFGEEALPWIDAVHRFALRLTRNPVDAEDLRPG